MGPIQWAVMIDKYVIFRKKDDVVVAYNDYMVADPENVFGKQTTKAMVHLNNADTAHEAIGIVQENKVLKNANPTVIL